MNKHKSNKIKENSNTVRHLIMGQITTTQNLVAIKEVRHAGQSTWALSFTELALFLPSGWGSASRHRTTHLLQVRVFSMLLPCSWVCLRLLTCLTETGQSRSLVTDRVCQSYQHARHSFRSSLHLLKVQDTFKSCDLWKGVITIAPTLL